MEFNDYYYTATMQSASVLTADFFSHPLYTTWTVQNSQFYNKETTMSIFNTMKILGPKSLFAGFNTQAISSLPGTYLYLQGRKQSLQLFGENDLGYCMQGPISVAAGMTLWSPAMRLTVLEQAAYQTNHFNQQSLSQKCHHIYQHEGIKGFYRGTLPATLSFSLSDAIGSWLQAQLLNSFHEKKYSEVVSELSATTLAFAFASFITSPIEMVITHLRLQETNPNAFAHKTFSAAAKKIHTEKGYRGFFRASPTWTAYQTVWHLSIPFTEIVPG